MFTVGSVAFVFPVFVCLVGSGEFRKYIETSTFSGTTCVRQYATLITTVTLEK